VADATQGDTHMGTQLIAPLKSERGTTLIETAFATALLLVVTVGLLSMAALATAYTENHGHLEARTTEYAQDKMEQLLAIAYTDTLSNTVVFPAAVSGGTGLSVGGGTDTAAPVNGYVDWLAYDGTLLGGGTAEPDGWFYERVWEITSPAGGIKQMTVTSTVRHAVAGALKARSTVVALKTSQF
jgi:hypothetical protein